MEAKVTWNEKMSFNGVAESGFPISLDTSPSVGGEGKGIRPMELMALGIAGCTAMDVISILTKKRQQVTHFEVRFTGEQAADHPKVFTRVILEYVVTGVGIDPSAVERAVELSVEKYCPAQAMIKDSVEMEHRITILEAV